MSSPVRVLERVEEQVASSESPNRIVTRVVGRVVRIAVALVLLLLSAWVLLPFGVVPVSMVAVTNARISRVRSSVNGQVTRFSVEVGDHVKSGEKLLEIIAIAPGARATAEQLVKEKSDIEIQDAALTVQVADTESHLQAYEREVGEYTDRNIAETDMRLRQATRELDASKLYLQQLKQPEKAPRSEEMMALDHEISRLTTELTDLRAKYSESHPDVQRVRATLAAATQRRDSATPDPAPQTRASMEQLAASREVEARNTAVERLRAQLLNLKSGHFVGPDMQQPPALALRDEAAAALAKFREQKLIAELQQRSIAERLEKILATSAGNAVVVNSTVDGIVWSRDIPSGQTVREGDDLVRIAEANTLEVEAYVDGRYARQLSIGDRAIVSLSSNKRVSGRIVSIQGPGQRKADADAYAIELKAPVETLYHVVVRLDTADRANAHIGQVAKVLFTGADSSLPSRLYSWISGFWAGSHS